MVAMKQARGNMVLLALHEAFLRELLDPLLHKGIAELAHRERMDWLRALMGRCTLDQVAASTRRSQA